MPLGPEPDQGRACGGRATRQSSGVRSPLTLSIAATSVARRLRPCLTVLTFVAAASAEAAESSPPAAPPAVAVTPAEAPTGRLTSVFEGIECEYSPGQEELARLLAHRFAVHNQETTAAQAAERAKSTPLLPLSARDLHASRAVYLGRIATLLGLERVTPWQDECYDAFLANYDQTMRLYAGLRAGFRSLQTVKRVTVWERSELVRRLESGEKISGLTYDPVTRQGNVSYGGQLEGDLSGQLQGLADGRRQLKLTTSLNLEAKDGVATYRGRVEVNPNLPAPAAAPRSAAVAAAPAAEASQWFQVIIPAGLPATPPEQLVQQLWSGSGDITVEKYFAHLEHSADDVPVLDPQIAFLVLHETVEIGIVERYYRGRDRRWFCDGMANYCAWRVLRDVQGEDVATQVHDLPAKLREYADLAGQADLRKWPASEHETPEESRSRLELARYAFAERAVALMDARGGDDLFPRLFAEIGKTAPEKVSIRTVEKAWKKLTGTKLDDILAEAVKPVAAATAVPAAKG